MKVTDVRMETYRWQRAKPIRNGRYVYPTAGLNVVKIDTDEGVTGIGLAGGVLDGEAIASAILDHLKMYVVGQDPFDTERVWDDMWQPKLVGRRGITTRVISGIDVALWDIAGKHYGAPVHGLLGGRHRERVRMCALTMGDDQETVMAMVTDAVSEGHTAVKIDPLPRAYPGWSHARLLREVVERVGAVREAVGDDVDICVELHRKLGPAEAVALAAKLEPFDLLFIEDPIPPDSIASMAEVAGKVNVPIATGERLHTVYEFKEVLESQAAQDLKLDVGLHGGITQCKKIAGLAEAYHATVSPHNAWGPVLTAAHVQLCAAVPNFLVLEYRHGGTPPEGEVVKDPLKVENGYIRVPDSPGIGVELNEEAARKYPYVPRKIATATRDDGSVAFR